jgi:uncharacterized protein (DUF1330 family)
MKISFVGLAAIALSAQTVLAQEAMPMREDPPELKCNQPVVMVVTGLTHDPARMGEYARAIAESKIYEQLGGYYLNIPRTLEIFEGTEDPRHTTLSVRFPCIENARAFWYSKTYQETILPMRLDPSAGDYSVRVYPEASLRQDMVGKVGDNGYSVEFEADAIEQVER